MTSTNVRSGSSRPAGPTASAAGRRGSPGPGRLLVATLLAASTLTIMAAAVIAPSLPQMREVFADAPAADVLVRLALTITSLAIGLTAPIAGAVADRVGRPPVLIGSLALYAVAGVAGYFVTDLTALLLTRSLLGVAVGGVMTAVGALITDLFDGGQRSRFLGLQQAFASLGGVVFLPLAGVLAGISWNAPSWIYVAAAPLVPLAVLAFRDARQRDHLRAEDRSGRARTDEKSVRTTPRGLVPTLYLVALVGTAVFFMAPTQLPFLLTGLDVPTAVVGLIVACSTASSAVAAVAFARARRRFGRTTLTGVSLALLGAGWIVVGAAPSVPSVVLGVLIGGLGVGLVVPNLNLWLSETVPPARRGRVLGGMVSAIFVGQFLSPLVAAPLLGPLGIGSTFIAAGALATLLGGTAALVLRRFPGQRS